MTTHTFKKLSEVAVESDFTSTDSQHVLVEDGGNIRRVPKNAIGKPITTTLSDTSTDAEVPSAKAVYDALSTSSPVIKAKEYGVRKLIDSILPELERVGDSVGLRANVCLNEDATNDVYNDFDNIYPWSHMRRCNLSKDGVVLAYEGDVNYSANGYVWVKDEEFLGEGTLVDRKYITPFEANLSPTPNGHCYVNKSMLSYSAIFAPVMVEIPKFYQKYETPGDGYEYWWVSDKQGQGYRCSPLFDNQDKIYISAYIASEAEEDGEAVLTSASGTFPATLRRTNELRESARKIGNGWELPNIAYYCDIMQHLMLIEFATFNISNIMAGYSGRYTTTSSSSYGKIFESTSQSATNTVKLYLGRAVSGETMPSGVESICHRLKKPDIYIYFTNSDKTRQSTTRKIINISENATTLETLFDGQQESIWVIEVTFDGDPIEYISTNDESVDTYEKYSRVVTTCSINGATDTIIAPSGQAKPFGAMKWRGLENIYSNAAQHVEGVIVVGENIYLTLDPNKYGGVDVLDADDKPSREFYDYTTTQLLPVPSSAINYYVGASLGYDANVPWARFPVNALETATPCHGVTDYTFVQNSSLPLYPARCCIGGYYQNDVHNGIFAYFFNHSSDADKELIELAGYIGTRIVY